MTPQEHQPVPCAASELEILRYIAADQDAFTGCQANGDFRARLQALAALRRAGLIDHAQRLTPAGRAALAVLAAERSSR